jgi:PAS domain S-box-containing protein
MSGAREEAFRACPVPIALLGPDGRVQDANDAWEGATGWRGEDLLGQALLDLLHPNDVPPWLAGPDGRVPDAPEGTWEARCRGPDGAWRPLSWNVAPAPGGRRVCAARDLAAEEWRRQERFKADFINLAAHELNTPLTPMQLALDTLGMRIDPMLGRDLRQPLDMVQRNFRRLRDLVADLLDAARLNAGSLPLTLADVDLTSLALQAVADKRDAAEAAGVELRADVEHGLRTRADAARLLQVLDTYLACALACAPRGSDVHLAAWRAGDEVTVKATCRGATLTPGQRDGLFHPFPAADGDDPPRVGSGLGLYMARGIVELHGGQAASRPAEDGLALAFSLPLDGPPAQATAFPDARIGARARVP